MVPSRRFRQSSREEPKYFKEIDQRVECAVLVLKKDYIDVIQMLASAVKNERQKLVVVMRKLVQLDDKIAELGLKVYLLVHDSQKMSRLLAQVAARDVKLPDIGVAASGLTKTLEAMTRDYASMKLE